MLLTITLIALTLIAFEPPDQPSKPCEGEKLGGRQAASQRIRPCFTHSCFFMVGLRACAIVLPRSLDLIAHVHLRVYVSEC